MTGITTRPPSRPAELAHAAALTEADVDALAAYLKARLDEVRDRNDYLSDEWRTAMSLSLVVSTQADRVRDTFTGDSPELLLARRRQWNELVWLVRPWEYGAAAGYDTTRWCHLIHADAADAARAAAYRRSCL
ncbi:hypothetical protein [Streptomyces violascens]|uniref:Uncharacterized protein n=1 Tax=Streptomyces violascens TaxID=67381 RepID=A0ABQ3QL89_9ACTN|nr:hypothetical protein [Streptomyces violascens]GGU44521.1 hypothetical protein GCM10010289_76380 [Streptomyces violascens]GHI38009.1 hypothetical protein Sviol_24170 [Streptomyces violascens]